MPEVEDFRSKRPAKDSLQFGAMNPKKGSTESIPTSGAKPNGTWGDALACAAIAAKLQL